MALDSPGKAIVDSISEAINTFKSNYFGTYGTVAYKESNVIRILIPKEIEVNEVELTQASCGTGSASEVKWFNCTVEGIPFGDYFYNGFPRNWTMWTFMFLIFMYFLVISFENDEMSTYYHKTEYWSHHPAYSINKQTTEIASKIKKMAFLWTRTFAQLLFMSLFNRFFSYTHLAIRLILFPLGAIAWSLIPIGIIGWIQNSYKKTFEVYVSEMKNCENLQQKVAVKEKWEESSYYRNYEFYVVSGAISIACSVISIIQMSEMPDEDHGWMILGLAIAVLFEILVLDIIVVFLAKKSEALNNLFKLRGYWYEYELENDFLLHGKTDF